MWSRFAKIWQRALSTDAAQTKVLWQASSAVAAGDVHSYTLRITSSAPLPLLSLLVANSTSVMYKTALLTGPYTLSVACSTPKDPIPLFSKRLACGEIAEALHPPLGHQVEISESRANQVSISQPSAHQMDASESQAPTDASGLLVYQVDVFSDCMFQHNFVDYTLQLTASDAETAEIHVDTHLDMTDHLFHVGPHPGMHLVILTHGLYGSRTDLLYLKQAIEKMHGTRVVVWTSDVNHCMTEDGIDVAAERIANDLVSFLGKGMPGKLSLIGHSLGGLVNLYLIGLLFATRPKLLSQLTLANFITLATPWCGSREAPWIVRKALERGLVGQAGKDLGLVPRTVPPTVQGDAKNAYINSEPLLLTMSSPDSWTHRALARFQRVTLYANMVNDFAVGPQSASLWQNKINTGAGRPSVSTVDANETTGPASPLGEEQPSLLDTLQDPSTSRLPFPLTLAGVSRLKDLLSQPPLPDSVYTTPSIPLLYTKLYSPGDLDISPRSIEETIAKNYHSDLEIRKTLLWLEQPWSGIGDGHTDIIVKRKYQGVGGWGVVQHILNETPF